FFFVAFFFIGMCWFLLWNVLPWVLERLQELLRLLRWPTYYHKILCLVFAAVKNFSAQSTSIIARRTCPTRLNWKFFANFFIPSPKKWEPRCDAAHFPRTSASVATIPARCLIAMPRW